MATGTAGFTGWGSPGTPQEARTNTARKAKIETRNSRLVHSPSNLSRLWMVRADEFRISIFEFRFFSLEDVTAQVLVLDDAGELLLDVLAFDLHLFFLQL